MVRPPLFTFLQDTCFNVRLAFLTKVIQLLQPRKLPPRYNVIPFLTVLDPEPETKNMVIRSHPLNEFLFFSLTPESGRILYREREAEDVSK